MAKALPEYPETSGIFRAGLARGTSLDRLKKHAASVAKSVRRASMPLIQRFISVPEYQAEELSHFLKIEDYPEAEIIVRPSTCKTFGEDQAFHEHSVTDAEQIVLFDASDFGVAAIETAGRINGEPQLGAQAFSAHFQLGSKLAIVRGMFLWGFQRRQGEGPYVGVQRRNASLTTNWATEAGFSVGTHYIQNLIVIRRGSEGFWPSMNYKEDLGRCVSEGTTGRYESILVRFTPGAKGRNAEDLDTPEGRAAERSLSEEYRLDPDLVKKFNRGTSDPRKHKKGRHGA